MRNDPSGERRPPFYRRFYLAPIGTDASEAPLNQVAATFQGLEPTDGDRVSLGDAMVSWLLKELVACTNDL